MPLTKRASSWLALLERETPVPTAVVERRIRDAGGTPHKVWLEFHETYAGYVESVGPDTAIWGLCRSANGEIPLQWYKPDAVVLVPRDGKWMDGILCADTHPAHDFEMLANGEFLGNGGPSESFECKLERHGLMMDFSRLGKVRRTKVGDGLDKPEHQALIERMRGGFVPEASDKHAEYYVEPKRLLRVGPFINQLQVYEIDPS